MAQSYRAKLWQMHVKPEATFLTANFDHSRVSIKRSGCFCDFETENFFRRTTLIRETRDTKGCHLEGSINKTRRDKDSRCYQKQFRGVADKERLGLSEEDCDGAEVNS